MDLDDCDRKRACVSLVQRPLLPDMQALAPYLQRIDAQRWYSNRGPLLGELETRLGAHFGIGDYGVMMMASGSAALESAILSHAGSAAPEKPLALMPSFTFVATAQSALRCGYQPYFLDIDSETWMLDAAQLMHNPILARAGVILPVAAMGRCPDMSAWEQVQEQTGCPVVVDAAASFEHFERGGGGRISSRVPAVLSMHATKSYSTAEGGAVLLQDREAQLRAWQVSNFGMNDDRACAMQGLNGKLSEYHAAVGLAQLDLWDARKTRIAALAGWYGAEAAQDKVAGHMRLSPDTSGAYVLFEASTAETAERAIGDLTAQGIGNRRWYGRGLHREPAFAQCGCDDLPATEDLSARLIGLPAAVDLTQADVAAIVRALPVS